MESQALPPRRLGGLLGYAVATAITAFAIYSQYFLPQTVPAIAPLYTSLLGDVFIVYGIPIISFLVLVGTRPLRSWRGRLGDATVQGLGWYGAMSIVAILVTIALALVYEIVDPGALALLSRPNPELTAAASNPWFYVGFSFVIGAIEETIFRGWIFGYWMARGSPNLTAHAIWTSIFFGAVHLYYGTTYGAAYPLVAPSLFFIGFAFAKTMQNSGGNLVIVALLHGANDATSFLTLINSNEALALHYGIVLVGAVIFLYLYLATNPSPPSSGPTQSTQGSWEATPGSPPPRSSTVDPSSRACSQETIGCGTFSRRARRSPWSAFRTSPKRIRTRWPDT
ncbi:MAG: type II CAAX endopeptidase family protein [Thermoplasmata archaeon]